MGLREYIGVKTSRLTRKTWKMVDHTVSGQILQDWLPDGLPEKEYQFMQSCASMLSTQYKVYETGTRCGCSNLDDDDEYELLDPKTIEFPGFTEPMREQMTSVGKYQVVLFRKRGSHQYVVAVRGTANFKDLCTDIRCLGEVLHKSSRVPILEGIVKALVAYVGAQNVVLIGHSLGAGVAMIVGQRLHLDNILGLKEFYFNPPYAPLDWLVSDLLSSIDFEMYAFKTTIYYLGLRGVQARLCERLKRLVASALGYDLNKGPEMETFLKLRDWHPYICINEYDRFCNGYADFFKKVESLSERGTLHTVNAVTSMTYLWRALGLDAKPHFLFPSANLIITNKSWLTLCAHQLSHWQSLKRSRIIEYKQVRGFSGVNWQAPA